MTCDFAKRAVLWTIKAGIFLAFIFHIAGASMLLRASLHHRGGMSRWVVEWLWSLE